MKTGREMPKFKTMTKEQALKKAEELNAARKGGELSHFVAHASSNPNIWVVCEYDEYGKCINIIQDAE